MISERDKKRLYDELNKKRAEAPEYDITAAVPETPAKPVTKTILAATKLASSDAVSHNAGALRREAGTRDGKTADLQKRRGYIPTRTLNTDPRYFPGGSIENFNHMVSNDVAKLFDRLAFEFSPRDHGINADPLEVIAVKVGDAPKGVYQRAAIIPKDLAWQGWKAGLPFQSWRVTRDGNPRARIYTTKGINDKGDPITSFTLIGVNRLLMRVAPHLILTPIKSPLFIIPQNFIPCVPKMQKNRDQLRGITEVEMLRRHVGLWPAIKGPNNNILKTPKPHLLPEQEVNLEFQSYIVDLTETQHPMLSKPAKKRGKQKAPRHYHRVQK